MYHNYQSPHKYTGIYRCPDNINHFKIRVKLKEIPDITVASHTDMSENWEAKEFKWQEKVFNNFEKKYFSNESNCFTDVEKHYHSVIVNSPDIGTDNSIFSYVNDDNFTVEDNNEYSAISSNIHVQDQVRMRNNEENSLEEVLEERTEFNYRTFLLDAIENISISDDNDSIMYIMSDMGEYVEENWVKLENILCILKYNKDRRILKIYPDFSNNSLLPYHLRLNITESTKNFYYFVEHVSDIIPEELCQKEDEIFKKICDYKKTLKHPFSNHFEFPHKNKMDVHVFFEITSGNQFENVDHVFVKYFVDLPEEKWRCTKTPIYLEGMTQSCHAKENQDGRLFFGHVFDLILEYDIKDFTEIDFPKFPYIYFEVISKDSWGRYRSEGLTYCCLPIARPGVHNLNLSCFRLSDGIRGELKRFFVGDCSNYKDVTWIGIPKRQDDGDMSVFNKYGVQTVSTGVLNVRMNVLHQSHAFLEEFNETEVIRNKEKFIFEKLNSSKLVKSVDEVLKAFRRARKNIIRARNS